MLVAFSLELRENRFEAGYRGGRQSCSPEPIDIAGMKATTKLGVLLHLLREVQQNLHLGRQAQIFGEFVAPLAGAVVRVFPLAGGPTC